MSLAMNGPKHTCTSGARVLVVEDDEVVRNDMARNLASHGYEVGVAVGQDGAISALQSGQFDVVLAEYEPTSSVGVELMEALSSLAVPPRPVLIRGRDADASAPSPSGAAVLHKPYQSEDLIRVVAEAAATASGFDAHLSGVNLIDMLQLLHFSQRTAAVEVDGQQSGHVYFERGEIVHATLGEQSGAGVLPQLLRITSGAIRVENCRTEQRSIAVPFQMLLLDLLRQEDEQRVSADEIDVDTAFKSYRAPSVSVRPSLLSLAPPPDPGSVAEISAACAKVVDEADGVVGCAVVDPLTTWIMGQHFSQGRPLPGDRLAMRVLDLLAEAVRQRSDSSPTRPLDGQLSSPDLLYLSRTFESCRAVLLLVARRSTSVGLGRAQIGTAIAALDALVLSGFERGAKG